MCRSGRLLRAEPCWAPPVPFPTQGAHGVRVAVGKCSRAQGTRVHGEQPRCVLLASSRSGQKRVRFGCTLIHVLTCVQGRMARSTNAHVCAWTYSSQYMHTCMHGPIAHSTYTHSCSWTCSSLVGQWYRSIVSPTLQRNLWL